LQSRNGQAICHEINALQLVRSDKGAAGFFLRQLMTWNKAFFVLLGSRDRRALLAVAALAGTLILPSAALAQSVWGGTGSTTSSSSYNLGTNWSTNPTAPTASGQSARFGASGNTLVKVNPGPVTPDSWTFNANSKSYIVTGGAVHFGNAATLTNNANAGQAISISNNMTGTTLSQAGASTLTISGTDKFTTTNVSAGTLVNNGTLTSGITNQPGGTLTTTGTINGDLTNRGISNASGTINGAIVNQGAGVFNVTSALAGSGTLDNNNTAQLLVSGGDFTGITTLTNNSTAAIGVNTAVGRTLSATTVVNQSGATIFNAGTLTATAGITNQPGGTLTTTGTINGDLTSRGTTNASGAINGAIVNQGTGVFNVTGALTGNNFLNNNNTAQLMVSGGDLTGVTLLRNNSTAATGVNIAATRTLSANVINNASGATISDAGTLIALTSFASAGTVAGAGSIVGAPTFTSGGTFAPGNGTAGSSMSVTGSLALQAGAIYMVQISPTTASFAGVTGTATLSGATVSANYAAGSYISKQYTILTTTGGISGTFGSLVNTNLPSGFSTALAYDNNNAYLNLTLNFTSPNAGIGLNGNQQAVSNAITNFFNTNGSIPMVFGALTPNGLTQISGEIATGSQQTTFDAMTQFMGVMTDPFMNRGGGANSATGATGYSEEGQASAYAANKKTDAFAMFTKAPVAPAFEPRWSVWVAGFGGSQSTDGNAVVGSNNTTSNVAATAVGADYVISPNTIAGFALAGGGTSFSVANGGNGHSDLFQAGAYVRHTTGPAYVSAALAYGWQDITTDRTVTVAGSDQLRAEFNANAWSGRVEGGYRFVSPVTFGIGITPYAAAQFTTFDLPAYAEQAIAGSNAFALTYNAKDVTDTRSELGVRTDKSFAMTDGILTLRGRVAWAHDYDPERSIGATFQTLPGASFVVNGAAQASDSALVTASVEKKWINGWSAAATFEGEFSDVTRSYAGKGVVRYAW
jgi:uncharacterized protein with beta-barrel porin domain